MRVFSQINKCQQKKKQNKKKKQQQQKKGKKTPPKKGGGAPLLGLAKSIYLSMKNAWLPTFFSLDSNNPCLIYFFPIVITFVKIPLY